MKTFLTFNEQKMDLDGLLSRARTIVTLGRNADEAYNVIAVADDSMDVFQCQFTRTEEGWKVQNGQWRTECPKGITSRLQHACNLCMGRCVNTRPAHPTYSWRTPLRPTLLNGQELPAHEATLLHHGDVLTAGNTLIWVMQQEGEASHPNK